MSSDFKNNKLKYILTGKRQITRILDVGLIIPELVACNSSGEILIFDDQNLSSARNVEGAPPVIILIELEMDLDFSQNALSVEAISAIHFEGTEEREDFHNRSFENVPTSIFKILVTPDLFVTAGEAPVGSIFPKLDKKSIYSKYRRIDMMLGLIWFGLFKKSSIEGLISIKENYKRFNPVPDTSGLPYVELVEQASFVEADDSTRKVLSEYFSVVEEFSLDNGWSSKVILARLNESFQTDEESKVEFENWYKASLAIVNNEKGLFSLTDDKNIFLRAMLLHLLNPDKESIDRFSSKSTDLGVKVQEIAGLICSAREGYSCLVSEEKTTNPGAFFFLSSLACSWVTGLEFAWNGLSSEKIDGYEVVKWNDQLVGKYELSEDIRLNEVPGEEVSVDAEHLDTLIESISSLTQVSNVDLDEDKLLIKLDKDAIKPVKIPTIGRMYAKIHGDVVIFSSCILNLETKTHLKKLTGPRLKSALKYQASQSYDFRFVTSEDNLFKAEVTHSLRDLDCKKAIELLIGAHVWMQSKAT